MAQEIDESIIHTNEAVTCVVQQTDDVQVSTTRNCAYTCQKLVLAIPPCQIGKIDFNPCLPVETREIIKRMPPSNVIKFVVTYKQAFWREAGQSGEVVTNGGSSCCLGCDKGPVCIVYDATSSNDNPALLGFIGGKSAVQWQQQTEESRKSAVLKSLSEFFGDKVYTFVDYKEKIWDTEPYTEGAPVSCVGPGAMRYLAKGLRHPFGKIHFAGTESATVWCGFMNGAVQAGRRAAIEVLYDLRPQMVSATDLSEPKTLQRAKLLEVESWNRKVARWTFRIGVISLIVIGTRRIFHSFQSSSS